MASLKNKTYPTLKEFYQYCNNADSVRFQDRNTTDFYLTLNRCININPRLNGYYMTRSTALSSFDFELYYLDGSKEDERLIKTITRLKQLISRLLKIQLKTVLFGKLLIKLKVIQTQNGLALMFDSEINNDLFEYDSYFVYLFEQNGGVINRSKYETLERDNLAEYLFDEYSNISKSAGGLLRTVAPIEIIRYDMILENANYLRKLKGILQIINKGGSDEEQLNAQTAAQQAVLNNYVVTSESLEFKLNEITSSNGNSFKEYIEAINKDISIALLGQANTSELPNNGGSRAALQILKMISADIFYSDMIRVEDFISQLLLLDFRLNFSRNASIYELPYRFRFKLYEEEDIEKNASALEIANRFIDMKKSEVYSKLGLSIPTDSADTLKANSASGNSF